MTNNYEYIQVDPKVIQMLGGSDDMQESIAGEFGGDLPRSAVESYGQDLKKRGFNESMLPDSSSWMNLENNSVSSSDKQIELLQQILQELKEVKIILAGR